MTISRSPTFEPEYSIAEAKTHLTDVVRETERGLPVHLTRRGVRVAVVLSQQEYARLKAGKGAGKPMGLYDAIKAWRDETGGIEWTDEEYAALLRREPQPERPNPFEE